MFGKKRRNTSASEPVPAAEPIPDFAALRSGLPDVEVVEGSDSGRDPFVFALSTCGFCRKAIAFLKERGVAFSYVYVDRLKPEEKKRIRTFVSETFNTSITYPFLIMKGNKWISGFLRVEWEEYFPNE